MKLAIAGAAGRMGRALIHQGLATPGIEVIGGGVRKGSRSDGAQADGVFLTSDIEALAVQADAIIDFTQPKHSLELAALAAKRGIIHICGTTGMGDAELAELKKHAKKARIVASRNMSVGVNLLLSLVEKMASVLGPDAFDIEIDEMHHRFKIDAPSGTALMLGEAAARGRGVMLGDVKNIYGFGHLGARKAGSIGFSVRRGGDVVGDHTVIFAGVRERIEVAHKSNNRDIYAAGAIRAALWANDQKPGFYTMRDVLGV